MEDKRGVGENEIHFAAVGWSTFIWFGSAVLTRLEQFLKFFYEEVIDVSRRLNLSPL